MGKKFTIFVVLLAAVLFALPTQAQIVKKAAPTGAMKTTVVSAEQLKAGKAAYEKANDKTVGVAFRGNAAVEKSSVQLTAEELMAMKAADKSVGKIFTQWDWAAHQAPKFISTSPLFNKAANYRIAVRSIENVVDTKLKGKVGRMPLKVQGDHDAIISEIPATAEIKYYQRSGGYYDYNNYKYSQAEQSGRAKIAFDGNDVYIQDPIAGVIFNKWVKGTKNGNTITVPLGQFLSWSAAYDYGLYITMATIESDGNGSYKGTNNTEATEITYTIDGNTITQNGTSANYVLTTAWSDDNKVLNYGSCGGEYGTVYTLDEDYVPPTPLTPPAGLETEEWIVTKQAYKSTSTKANVGIDGSNIYIQGLFSYLPDAWIKGTISGTTATFEGAQFIGSIGSYDLYVIGGDPSDASLLPSFTMTYDEENKSLELDETNIIDVNVGTTEKSLFDYIMSLTISAPKPVSKVDELPYANSFNTTDEQQQFTIIDANGDGSTWAFYDGMVRYKYNSTYNGDDWLVSPAIKLVAGKKYHFSIGARAHSATYPERFEVKAATENTAEALAAGTEVLPSTDVTTVGFVTYENNEFTVAESGYYYIGVHAISDADKYYLYVDDFVLEAAPITAPYVADFTTEAPFGDFSVIDNNEDGKTWTWSASNYANYTYSSTLAADDYLILPIKLEAGKNYDVTVNAANSGYPEKFEVKVGKEGTVEGLSTVAIAETEVTSKDFTDFSGSFTTDEAGTYYVAIHATSDADKFRLKVKTLTIEVGAAGTAPAAVNNLTVTPTENKIEATVVFDAPSVTIDGNEMTENLTKIDVLRDGVVIESFADVAPGSERTFVDNEEKGLTIGTHKYQVIPYNADGIGQKSEEVSVRVTAALNVPYTFDLTQDQTGLFTIIDNNADGKTWSFSSSIGTIYSYSSTNPGDDYLVSPAFNLEAGKSYKVTVNAKSYNSSYTERFEVKVGKVATAEGLNITAIGPTEVSSTEAEDFEGEFTANEAGQYFIAIHAISDPDNLRLVVNSLSVEKGLEPTAPAAPELAVTPAAEGAKSAQIEVTAPSTTVGGDDLMAENLSKIEILRDNEVLTTLNVLPGNVAEYTDENVPDGLHTYQAIPYDKDGNPGKKSEKVTVYVGIDTPADVQNFHVKSTTANSITFAWDAATGAHGGYVNSANMKYEISTLAVESSIFGSYLVVDQTIANVTGQTELTIDFPVDEGEQMYQYFGISANDGTAATDATMAYSELLVGAPLDIPLNESFEGSTLHYAWSTNGGLGVSTNSSDEDGVALKLYNDGTSANVYFMLDKVNLKSAANPTLLLDVRSESTDKVYGIGSKDGGDIAILNEGAVTADYTTFKVPLSSIKDAERYASVGIIANIETPSITQYEDTLIIDNIRIVDLYEHDLAVSVKAPKNINAGENAPIKVTVENQGENDANGYTLVIKAGDKELFNKTVNEALPAFKESEYDVTLETTIFDDTQDITVSAEVIYDNDLNPDNNKAETIVSVKGSTLAQPENVKAVQNADETVKVSWTAPSTDAAAEITDDVESYEEFDCGGLNEEVHTGNIGAWTVYDGNAAYCYGFDGITVPNLGDKNAWLVMAPASEQVSQDLSANYPAHSGDQYFISACCAEPDGAVAATDHWLISPELTGVEQTISFYARVITAQYGAETYEVLASSTDAQPASFTKVAEGSIDATEWTEVTAQLPADTKFFAIRHTSTDVFGLMVDDITYLGGASAAESFNIYVNGEKIANVAGDKTEYIVTPDKFAAGEQSFAVSAVYASGESKPVEVKITVVTGIKQIADGNKTFDVYTLDGKLVRQQAKSLEGLKGVYVINGKAVMVK